MLQQSLDKAQPLRSALALGSGDAGDNLYHLVQVREVWQNSMGACLGQVADGALAGRDPDDNGAAFDTGNHVIGCVPDQHCRVLVEVRVVTCGRPVSCDVNQT